MILYKRVIKSEPITIQPDYSEFKSKILHPNKFDIYLEPCLKLWLLTTEYSKLQIHASNIFQIIEILLLGDFDIDLPEKYFPEFDKKYLEIFKGILVDYLYEDYDIKKIIKTFEFFVENHTWINDVNDFDDYYEQVKNDDDYDLYTLIELVKIWQVYIKI